MIHLAKHATIVFFCCIAGLAPSVTTSQEQPSPTRDAWARRADLYESGLRECEKFRAGLLQRDGRGTSPAELIGQAIAAFPAICRPALGGRTNLDGFRVPAVDVVRQFRGQQKLNGQQAFGGFTGRWYGRWDQMRVDHHWRSVLAHRPPQTVAAHVPAVTASQFCWIGDGFCWNYVVRPEQGAAGSVLFGMCYHLDLANSTQIRLRRAHVGYLVEPGKLIWVTDREIFFEEVLPVQENGGRAYGITGFVYQISDGRLTSEGKAFQAVYTQQPDRRPPWFQFPIRLSVGK